MASPPPQEQASPPASPPPPPEQASSPTSPPPPPEQASPPASPPSNPPPPPPVVSPVSPPTTTPPPVSPPTSSPPPPAPVSPPVSPPSPSPAPPPPTPSDPPRPVSSPPPPASTSPPPVSPPPPASTSPPPASSSPPPASTSPPPVSSPPPPASTSPPPVSSPPPSVSSSPPPVSYPPPPVSSSPPPSNPSQPPPSEPSPPSPLGTPPPSPPPRPLLSSPPPPYQPPPPPTTSSSSASPALIAGIAGGVVGAALLVALLIFLLRRRRVKHPYPSIHVPSSTNSAFHPPPPASSSSWPVSDNSLPHPQNPPLSSVPPPAVHGGTFTYEDLASATNGFSESNLLGQGGFGLVYRGTLSGIEVAIKKLKLGSSQGDREFRAEVEIISRIHHRNLVTLVGYCIHMDERLLVYEYVPNKTLNFHLHGSGRPALDWLRRWKIALGSARGLAYLHEDCAPKIIHRDIKAENILLDFNFEPKVADFGLAKLVPTHISHVSSRIVGTFGYLAPEYVSSGKVTDKSDVYSYGVMLLELITGKKPVMEDVYEAQSLVDWARPMLLRAITDEIYDELIDKRLETNYDQYDMTRLIHCAAAAVRYSSRKRPRMSQIVRYLEGDISLEDLNVGTKPGISEVKANSSEQEVLRRMAFCGIVSEDYAESDQMSEYEVTSSSGANTEEMEQQRLNRKRQSGSQ